MGTPRSDDGGRSARRGESAAGADCQASMGSSPVPWVEVGRVGPGGELVEGLPLGTSVVYTRPAGQVGFCGLRNSRGRGDGSWERLGDAGRRVTRRRHAPVLPACECSATSWEPSRRVLRGWAATVGLAWFRAWVLPLVAAPATSSVCQSTASRRPARPCPPRTCV